ncbi:MAG: hypothetical protein U0003_00900 [Vampirovibrionales bacterium]
MTTRPLSSQFGITTIAPNPNPYGIRQIGTQQYLPIQAKRQLTQLDQAEVQRGLNQWWPTVFQSYATPLHNMLASPAKSGIIGGLIGGGIAGLYAAFLRKASVLGTVTKRNPWVALGVGAVALGMGAISYFTRQQTNENVLDLMQRLPEGATKRDMLSDPVYQKDLDRQAMLAGSHSFGGDLATVMIAQSLLNSGGGYRRR